MVESRASTGAAAAAGAPAARLEPHPPLPGPAHVHAALAGGVPGWQITLITAGAAVLAAVLAVLGRRTRAVRRVTPDTAEAMTTSGATR